MATKKLTPEFLEFLKSLNETQTEYLVIGGYAVAFYGYMRPTQDLDVWVAIHPRNVAACMKAFVSFGFGVGTVTPDDFATPRRIFRMGRPPNRLEVLTEIPGVQFDDCFSRRVQLVIDGVPVPVISLPDLRINKLASGRTKDVADVEQLDKRRRH